MLNPPYDRFETIIGREVLSLDINVKLEIYIH